MAIKTVSRTYAWGNIEITKTPKDEGGDIWQHILSFLDAKTLAFRIPLVSKELKAISARDVLWEANLRRLPQRILSLGYLSAKGKYVAHLKEPYLLKKRIEFIEANSKRITFIEANSNLEIHTSETLFLNNSIWGPNASMTIESKKRVFEDDFLRTIKDGQTSLKAKAAAIKQYMENHFFLPQLIKNNNQKNRADLIEAALMLGCNPNQEVEHFPVSSEKVITTPLHAMAYEALFDQRYVNIVQCLLEYRANPFALMKSQGTPRKYIRTQTEGQLAHHQRFFFSLFIPQSRSDNLRASHRRLDALLLRYERLWKA